MIRPLVRNWNVAAVLTAGMLLLGGNDAQAGWWSSCGSSGGGYSSWSGWGSGGSWGGYGSYGSYGSYGGGSYGSYGSYGGYGSYGSYGYSSHGSYGSYYGANSGAVYSARVYSKPSVTVARTSKRGTIQVSVPAQATVYVNGHQTKSTGQNRRYSTSNLDPGKDYKFEVRAELVRDGQKIERTQTISLRAGQSQDLAFSLKPQNPETVLTLNVPDDAKVFLASTQTKSQGPVRIYKTTNLASGQQWSDYQVVVTVKRGGRVQTQERTIALKAGANENLRFDFDETRVASAH